MNRADLLQAVDDELARRDVRDFDDLPAQQRDVVRDTLLRALAAGAEPPLEFVGAGAEGGVYCDGRDLAFKVGRHTARYPASLADEADWLATASAVPGVRERVAHFVGYRPDLDVIERECVRGERVPWHYPLFDVHAATARVMREHGWSAPEFKTDSYVLAERGPVLVDAGFVSRRGERLADYVTDVLDGRRHSNERLDDFAWALRWDFDEPRPLHIDRLLERLYAMGAKR